MEHIRILGSKVALADYAKVMDEFDRWVSERGSHQVCIANVHTNVLGTEDTAFQRITNDADLVTMDGKPLVWAAKLKGYSNAHRVSGPDLMMKVFKASVEKGYSHFLYGGAEGVSQELQGVLERRFPGVKIVGGYSPPFRPLTPKEDAQIVHLINSANPDFLWVGLGAPKQEKFIHDHLGRINVPVQVGVGAAFDFISGRIKRAPVWMQYCGLEWLYRFFQDPKRLWKRYVVYNSKYIYRLMFELRRSVSERCGRDT